MTRNELIAKCNYHVGAAHGAHMLNQHEHYTRHMSTMRDLLIEELGDSAPDNPDTPPPESPQ